MTRKIDNNKKKTHKHLNKAMGKTESKNTSKKNKLLTTFDIENLTPEIQVIINKYIQENDITNKSTIDDIKAMCRVLDIYVPSKLNKPMLIDLLSIPSITCEKKNNIITRLSTLQYEAIKDYIDKNYESKQPAFTEHDKLEKIKIWGCNKGTSSFSETICDITKGDHIYGIREGLKKNGFIGSNSLWNMIPCTHNENTSWKKIGNKNLVYDNFTAEEITKFDALTKEKYDKLEAWKTYCKSRKAKLYWINGIQINTLVTNIILPILESLNTQIQALPEIDQDEDNFSKIDKSKADMDLIDTEDK